jgi:hypothetical protein
MKTHGPVVQVGRWVAGRIGRQFGERADGSFLAEIQCGTKDPAESLVSI